MDAIDRSILAALEQDGRQSFTTLAERVGLSKTPCWSRVQQLEKSGAIAGYHAEIDPRSLDLGVFAFVQVSIDFTKRDAFERAVEENASIIECHTMAGDADYIIKVICRDVDDLDALLRFNLSSLPGVQRSATTVCLKTIKARGSITAAHQRRNLRTTR